MMGNAESSFRATPDAVHKLQKILQRIAENDGNIVAKEIWREEDIESKLTLEQASKISNNRDASISVGNSRLSRLEDLLGAIEFLQSSLERRISDFRQHKPSRTITDIPDELLVLILDMAGGAKPSLRRLSRLSLVCKRFRHITISIPSLWARKEISSSMPRYVIDQLVGRTGTLGLCMKIKSSLGRKNAIFKYRERWTEITLDLTPSDLLILQERAPSTELASLRKLSLTGPQQSFELHNYLFNDDWCPAALDSLHCFSALPTQFTAPNLTSFSLECKNIIDMYELKTFLINTPLLENISIVFREMYGLGRDENAMICLPLLKNFSFKSVGAGLAAVKNVFQTILFPNISTLNIDIQATSSDEDEDTMFCFWAAIKGMKTRDVNLKKLDLKLAGRKFELEEDRESCCMQGVFSNVPESIQSFSLSVRNMMVDVDYDDNPSISTSFPGFA